MEKAPATVAIGKDRNIFFLTIDNRKGLTHLIINESMKSLWSKYDIDLSRSIITRYNDNFTYNIKTPEREFTITFQDIKHSAYFSKIYQDCSKISQDKSVVESLDNQMKGAWPFPVMESF